MKVFAAPEEVQRPIINPAKYRRETIIQMEKIYLERLKAHLIKLGYTGPNTGEEFRIPWGDGYARYMVAEAGQSMVLVHLPLGDAWLPPAFVTRDITRADVLRQIRTRSAFEAGAYQAVAA